MSDSESTVAGVLRTLEERAKELGCLYTVEELTTDSNLSLEQVVRGLIETIPQGLQYSDACQARITYKDQVFQSPDFRETPWALRSPVLVNGEPTGAVEVVYTQSLPQADEGPFLRGERKLIDTIADRLGHCITHRRLTDAMREWRRAQEEMVRHSTHQWSVILELLRQTDQSLLLRIARKMINRLRWSGVTQADALLPRFGRTDHGDGQGLLEEANRPQPLDGQLTDLALVDEAFRLAAAHLSDEEILACIHTWIKQDRASFLVSALENQRTSLAGVADVIHRYQHATSGQVDLSPSTRKGLRVSLVRRFLSDQLEYINIAKNYVDIPDFHELVQRVIYPSPGYGQIGGKGSGVFLAGQIIRHHSRSGDLLAEVKTPRTWYLASDGMNDFVYRNHLEDVFSQKYKDIDQIRQEYPDIVQLLKHSSFSPDIVKGLSMALDDLGEQPLIVRSSSLLEDRFGAAFSGKYKSLFIANQGTKQERLRALCDAIAEVYASVFSPDPIEYRAERNLLDFQEGMAVLIQPVVGTRVGDYFLPTFAGVAFSRNEFRWSPRIKREDGLVRMVMGLGTRAVDRLGDDYPVLVSPGQPGLRANATSEEILRYSPRYLDLINLRTNRFETAAIREFLRAHGGELRGVEQLVSVYDHGSLRQPLLGQLDFDRDDVVVTCEGLLGRTPFLKQMQALLTLLERELHTPVDIEFAFDGQSLWLLQCRPQTPARDCVPAAIPRDLPSERVVFSATRHVSNGQVPDITHIVYVRPDRYAQLHSREELVAVGRAVSRLNQILPKRQFILMGPGRWGSRGDIRLGVQVTYSDINNTAMLIEIARKKGDYTPDLSFGTHFFQDLVEAGIRYLPLYPDEDGARFNEHFLTQSGSILTKVAPEFASLSDTVYVVDVPKVTGGKMLRVLMNADLDEAVGVLADPIAAADSCDISEIAAQPARGQDWRWRMRMAERIAAQVDPDRFGVAGFYVFGSTKNATAGPASDIDVLIHFRGTPEQRATLERWLEGWSLCLSEINYLRTGYQTAGLLDVHIVTDEDIARRSSYAVKIDAVTDAALPLPLRQAAPAISGGG